MSSADIDIKARSELYLKLIERQKVAIWTLCLHRAHYNLDRARDMSQEVMLALWKYMGSLRPDCTVEQERRWVLLRARGILLRMRQAEGLPLVEAEGMPEVAVEPDERDERLPLLLDRLDADDRRLMQMHLDGFSFAEIGTAMGISAAAARMRKSRIMHEMRKMAEKIFPQSERKEQGGNKTQSDS